MNKEKIKDEIIKKYRSELTNISDLYGDGYNDMSLIFYMLNKRYLHWLSNNPDIAIREKDMENYAIEVHSLKSDSKYLGIDELYKICLNHELKSKENDYEYIKNNFDELLNVYNKYKQVINNYLK